MNTILKKNGRISKDLLNALNGMNFGIEMVKLYGLWNIAEFTLCNKDKFNQDCMNFKLENDKVMPKDY
jgi:hypothetical protein